jgi:hypothetical protein
MTIPIFPHSNTCILLSPVHDAHVPPLHHLSMYLYMISQLIRYARACSVYDKLQVTEKQLM